MSKRSAKFLEKEAHFEHKNISLNNTITFQRGMSDPAKLLIIALKGTTASKTWIPLQSDLQKRLGWGKDKMREAIKECVRFGYMRVIQRKGENGRFDYHEFHFDDTPSFKECLPDGYNPHPVDSAPVNPSLPCSYDLPCIKEQTNKQSPKPEPLKKEEPVLFVCSSEEDKEKHKLLNPHFSAKAMYSLMKYSLEQIQQALLAYEDSARNRKIDNPAGYIVRALENGWKPPLSREDTKETNKQYAMKFREKRIGNIEVNCAANHVEIMSEIPYKTYFNKKYNDEGFLEKFNSSLKQCGFIE